MEFVEVRAADGIVLVTAQKLVREPQYFKHRMARRTKHEYGCSTDEAKNGDPPSGKSAE